MSVRSAMFLGEAGDATLHTQILDQALLHQFSVTLNNLIPLGLSFFISKMAMLVAPVSLGCSENYT